MFEPSTVTIAEAVNNHHLPYSKARLLGAQTLGLGPPDMAFLYRKMWTMQTGRILVYDRYVGHTLTECCGSIRTTKCRIFALPDKCAARQCSCVSASLDFKSDHVRLLTWIDREAWTTLLTIHVWHLEQSSSQQTRDIHPMLDNRLRRWPSIGSMCRVCWDLSRYIYPTGRRNTAARLLKNTTYQQEHWR